VHGYIIDTATVVSSKLHGYIPNQIKPKQTPEYATLLHLISHQMERNFSLSDPNSKFSTTPDGTMKYAEFMSRVGTIKAKPASWKDLFFPPIYTLPGS
jgi:NitT/TauT family transport system substrate-binding protein